MVGKALENIASYYPHFSNHNESNSHQILVNIERLLGDNIHLLSATDTWLLLESAYWHDVGMLFSGQQAQEAIHNRDFIEYLDMLANDNAQDLHQFAKTWQTKGWQQALAMYDNPMLGTEKYRQLMAEWYRRKHPERSQQFALDPFKDLNINSPRTELLPQRLYRYLGQICLAHGTSFEQVMSELPYRQTGMGTENCHPRFVACLLRLGDLFDIDDNRFCPVMRKQPVAIPTLSETHYHKHLAIREFQLDNQTVSITAECPDEYSFIETQNWFGWIKEEMQNQMSQWKNIVPHRKFGLLPTIQKLDVRMQSSKVLLSGKPMKFQLDEKNVTELLQGSNLYSGESNIYRELIQNAIDATYLRIWIEHGVRKNNLKITDNLHPFHDDFQKILEQYPIDIDFIKIADDNNSDSSLWQLSITDRGTGISLKDLEYMQKIAGSSRNIEKKRLIQDMPVWMRPSGAFGIGLHSAFLLLKDGKPENNKILIETTSIVDNSSYKIEMNSPLSSNQGYCFVERISEVEHVKREYGTKLMLRLNLDRRGKKFNESGLSFNRHKGFNSIISDIQKNYDVIKSPAFDYLCVLDIFAKIEQIIISSSAYFKFNKKKYDYQVYNDGNLYWSKEFNFYIHLLKTNFESLEDFGTSRGLTFFKGQKVDDIFTNYFDFSFDFYGFDAKEALGLDRNKWKKDFLENIIYSDNFLEKALYSALSSNSEAIKKHIPHQAFDIILQMLDEPEMLKPRDNWDNFKFFNESKTFFGDSLKDKNSFKKLLEVKNFYLINHGNVDDISKNIDRNDLIITESYGCYNLFFEIFKKEWCKNGGIINYPNQSSFGVYHFTKENSNNNLIVRTVQYAISGYDNRIIINQDMLDEFDMGHFKLLACRSEAHLNIAGKENKNLSESFLILPYFLFWEKDELCISKKHNYDFLVESTFQDLQKNNVNITRESVEQKYNELIEFVDERMSLLDFWNEALERGAKNNPKSKQEIDEIFNACLKQ
ncbi:HD domain-containing protein [Moraxella lacunata]|uniref:HD domain-containing protein n=1 Tax=Moraxella lacunata TaxID=477 RepID=UPI003EE41810